MTCFTFAPGSHLQAQVFGGNPPSHKWKQINTDTVRVIFPAGLETEAQRAASVIQAMARDTTASIGQQLYKINIVMQNQTTIANGYVALGPFRSEFYMTASLNNFDLGSINWNDALSTHEYRHVQQYNNFRNGASKLLYRLFGEEGLLLGADASVPDWFYEGDAVYNETRLSNQGRGRIPYFLNQYPALWNAGKDYSWMKLRNGSLKDYVPSHYPLGYLLVNYGYRKYGNRFWEKVTHDASAFKGLFYPFQKAIKRYSGTDYRGFIKNAFASYRQPVNQEPATGITPVFPVNKKFVTNYYFPYQLGEESVLFLRSSYKQVPGYYLKKGDKVKRLATRAISIDEQYSYRNGKIVYATYRPDARWGWRDYSEIRIMDINTGKQQILTHRTKYFTPDISPDGTRVVAVLMDGKGNNALHLLDAASGALVMALPNTGEYIFTDPKFINDNELVSAVRFKDGRMALAKISTGKGEPEWLTPPSYAVIGYPQVYDGMVYFTASYFDNDEVYAVSLKEGRCYRVSRDITGDYFVNRYKDKILFSRFTAEGLQLAEQKAGTMTEVNSMTLQESFHRYPVAGQGDGTHGFLQQVPAQRFAVKRYSKTKGLLNFHSWRPYYEDPEFTFSLYGQNVLNTMETQLYYLYDQNDRTNAVGLSTSYGGFFPFINAGTQMTFARQDSVQNLLRQWNQLNTYVGLSVPLNFSGGMTYKFLDFGTYYFLRNEFNTGLNKDVLATNTFTYLDHFISWSQQVQSARQHIFPRFANSVSIDHRYAVTRLKGYRFRASAALYLPGLFLNHNLVLTGSFMQRDTSRALFSSGFANARGYADYYRTNAGSRMWRLSANYHFPRLLPDWGFGDILYFRRIRANGFYDFQRLFSNNKRNHADLRSAGMEFYADTRWWNVYELTFGIRFSYLLDTDPLGGYKKGSTLVEIILPVSIIPR